MTCSHNASRSAIQACMLRFGQCWYKQPSEAVKAKHGHSNKPSGTAARDGLQFKGN